MAAEFETPVTPVPEEPKKKNTTLIIIIVVAAVLLLCCCCLVTVGIWQWPAISNFLNF